MTTAFVCALSGLVLPSMTPRVGLARSQPPIMSSPNYEGMLNLLNQWVDDEDGDSSECMMFMSVELLAERVGTCGARHGTIHAHA